ncbi:MAG: sugar ABC transporter permease [Defluviitaleaceae bacterium]|nr:sugar ABC transporter permease [Defluviitaleaceae bacterium]
MFPSAKSFSPAIIYRKLPAPRLSLRRREALTGLAFAAIPLAGMAVFFVAPFIVSVWLTFRSGLGGAYFVGLKNYRDLLASEAFRLAVGNTARFIGVGAPLLMALSLLVALALMTGLRAKGFFRAGLMLPMVIPSASVILFFKVIFEQNGTINNILAAHGMAAADFLNSGRAFYILLLLYVWKNFGYDIILFMAGLSQIPADLYESAQIDGAGPLRRFFRITLPLLTPTAFFVFVMAVIQAFKAFREIFALSGTFPDRSIYMLQHFMNNNFQNLNYQRLGAAAFLTFIVIFAIVGALFLLRRRAGDYEL